MGNAPINAGFLLEAWLTERFFVNELLAGGIPDWYTSLLTCIMQEAGYVQSRSAHMRRVTNVILCATLRVHSRH